MSKSSVLIFNGGSVGEGGSCNVHNLQLGVMTVNLPDFHTSRMYVLLDRSIPIESDPGYAPVDRYILAEWIHRGDVIQVDCANLTSETDTSYAGALQSTTAVNQQGHVYTSTCTIRLDVKSNNHTESRYYRLEAVHDTLTDIWYLGQDVNEVTTIINENASNKVQNLDNNSGHYPSCSAVKEAMRVGKLHRIGVRSVQAGEPSPKPQTDWIIDLESPNASEPDGYDRLTVSKAIELHENGEIFIFTNFGSATLDSSSCWFYESSVLASSNSITIELLRSYMSNDVREVQGANLTSFGDYVGVLDWNGDEEFWRETFVTEGSNSLNHNKIHRLRPATDSVIGETSNYGGWVLDLESPNENAPGGYDRLTPQKLKQILDNGEFLAIETYTSGSYIPLALQALVDVQNQNPLRIRIDFVRQYVYSNLLGFEQMTIYTPSGEESYLQMRGIGPSSSWWLDKEALAINGDGSDVTAIFTETATRTNITTGSKLSVLFGTIKKWFTDLKALAFKDKADLTQDVTGVLPIANGGTNASTIADARTNLDVYSKAEVNTAIDTAVASAYHAAGTKTVAQLTSALLVAENQGNVYNITDSGTTTADFVEGAGRPIRAGDNVGICDVGGGVYKFDLLSGFVDLSGYLAANGDGSDITASFTTTSTRTNISTGEKLSILFGKIAKWFGDLKALAFKDTVTDSDISGTISDSHIASAATWNGKQNTISTDSDSSDISDATTIATGYGSDKVHLNTAARLWAYIQGKIDTVLGLTSSKYAGTAATANHLRQARCRFGDDETGYRLMAYLPPESGYSDAVYVFNIYEVRDAAILDKGVLKGTLSICIRNNNGSYQYSSSYTGYSLNDIGLELRVDESLHGVRLYAAKSNQRYCTAIYELLNAYQLNGSEMNPLLYNNNHLSSYINGTVITPTYTLLNQSGGTIPLANNSGVGSALEPVYVSSYGEVLPCNLRGVYFSQYNDDSLSNILNAFGNGLLVFSKYAGDVYLLLDADSNGARFVRDTTVDGKTYYSTLTVNSNNVWSQTRDNIFNNIAVRKHYGANHEASVITTATDISNGYVEYALDFTDMQFGGGLSIVFVSLPNESALAYYFTRIDVMTYPYKTGYSSIDICKFTDLTHDDDGNAIGANDEYTWIRTCNSPNYGQRIKGIKLRAYLNMTSGLPWDAGIELKLKIDFNAVRFDKL